MWRLAYLVPFWLLLFLVRQAVILAGFIVTPFALLFATERDTYRVPKWAEWRMVRLGHKIFPKYNGRDWSSDPLAAIKGFTFRFDKG